MQVLQNEVRADEPVGRGLTEGLFDVGQRNPRYLARLSNGIVEIRAGPKSQTIEVPRVDVFQSRFLKLSEGIKRFCQGKVSVGPDRVQSNGFPK